MWIETAVSGDTGSNEPVEDVSLPPAVGEGFGRLYGSDPPETVGEWVGTMRSVIEREHDRTPTAADLCTTDDGDHAFVGDETEQTYICVLDPLVYPFLTGETGTVRSTTPVRGTEVTFEVGEDGIIGSHDESVVSVGVSTAPESVGQSPIETVYREVCGYIQTFEDRAEYETWAEDVDAATTAVPAAVGVEIVGELAETLFDAEPTVVADDAGTATGCGADSDCC